MGVRDSGVDEDCVPGWGVEGGGLLVEDGDLLVRGEVGGGCLRESGVDLEGEDGAVGFDDFGDDRGITAVPQPQRRTRLPGASWSAAMRCAILPGWPLLRKVSLLSATKMSW